MKSDGYCEFLESERCFEGCLSLILTAYALPFGADSALEFINALCSMAFSAWGLASFLVNQDMLALVHAQDHEVLTTMEDVVERSMALSGFSVSRPRRSRSGSVDDSPPAKSSKSSSRAKTWSFASSGGAEEHQRPYRPLTPRES